MNLIRRATIVLLRFFKQLNLFNTYTTNENKIRHEIITTRIYLILLPTILTILIIYSAQKELYYTVQVDNPSLDTYERLLNAYPDSLMCPCSELSISYSSFVSLTPHFHSVCSSDFISDRWLEYLYRHNASSYISADIRCVGNAQFQILRTLCQSSKEAIDNALQAKFTLAAPINSRGALLPSELIHSQAKIVTDGFISNIASEQRRQRVLFGTFIERNFLLSGLPTSARIIRDGHISMKTFIYSKANSEVFRQAFLCDCGVTYACQSQLGLYNIYSSDSYMSPDVLLQRDPLMTVKGFRSGCFLLNSLLSSTLECYHSQSCLNRMTSYISPLNISFNSLDRSLLNRSTPTTPIGALVNQLMLEEWSIKVNYSQYFVACRPISCTYTYTERLSILYVFTTLIGLLGGLIVTLRLLCPQITNILYRIQNSILIKHKKNPIDCLSQGKRMLIVHLIDSI